MQIYDEKQLDFTDVILRPRKSSLNSRSEADVLRDYQFKWTKNTTGLRIKATGIISANMSTTGTFEIAEVMAQNNLFSALHKHYRAAEVINFLQNNSRNDLIFVSTGVSDTDYQKLKEILDTKLCNNICIDIANGYAPIFFKKTYYLIS